ncbi:MAG: carbohydrate ABC transporter permease [Acidimicrobiia bacterium]
MTARSARGRREAALGYLMIAPALVVFGVFIFYPFLKNFQTALYLNPPFPGLPKRYVGLRQFSDILGSADFSNSLKATIAFAFLTVPAGLGLGLLLAVTAHRRLRGIGIYRTIFSSTVATSVAVAAVIFSMLFNPIVGLLPWLGVDPKPPIIENPDLALVAVGIVTIWQTLGLTFILLSAGLQGIPDELNEAAQVDGAGAATRFWRVTIPMLSPTLFFAFVVGTIHAFQSFGQIDILTSGGPFKRTNVLTYSIVSALSSKDQAADQGKAAVLAIALFVITLGFTLIQMRTLERRVHYAR